MLKKLFIFLCCFIFAYDAVANPCDEYKNIAKINLKTANPSIIIKSGIPNKDKYVEGVTNIKEFFEIEPEITYVLFWDNGNARYCVFLKNINATFGFRDFEVIINEKRKKDSCEYNAVLEHENQHIKDANNVLKNSLPEIQNTFIKIAKSVDPIYVENTDDVPYAYEKIKKQTQVQGELKKLLTEFDTKVVKAGEILDSSDDKMIMLFECEKIKLVSAFEKYNNEKNKY